MPPFSLLLTKFSDFKGMTSIVKLTTLPTINPFILNYKYFCLYNPIILIDSDYYKNKHRIKRHQLAL